MSRYRGNADTCAGCGLLYRDLRTGLTFMVKNRTWHRRGTVLGFWHQIKREEWAHHRETCEPPRAYSGSDDWGG